MSVVVVERVGPGASVQDLGRPGHLHEGVPTGGALVPELLVASNRALGNADDAAAIELPLNAARFRAESELTIALDGRPVSLKTGETLEIPTTTRSVRYVALPGGVDVPRVLGGRGTLVVARLGGHEGRHLRVGDRLRAVGGGGVPEVRAVEEPPRTIRLVAGPDRFPDAALELLVSVEFRIAASFDRVGTRLVGERLPAPGFDRARSAPMVRGAVQVAHDGTPIVLGPDHPTTGGYPVIAAVVSAELGAFASWRPGEAIRFRWS